MTFANAQMHFLGLYSQHCTRRGGLMVSELDSGFGAWPGTLLCSWERHCTLTVPLSTQVYKWVTPKILGVTLRWTSSRFILRKPEKIAGLMGLSRLVQRLPFLLYKLPSMVIQCYATRIKPYHGRLFIAAVFNLVFICRYTLLETTSS